MNDKLFVDQKNKFNSLSELIEFYQKNPAGLIYVLKYAAEKNFIDIKSIFSSLSNVYSNNCCINKFDLNSNLDLFRIKMIF